MFGEGGPYPLVDIISTGSTKYQPCRQFDADSMFTVRSYFGTLRRRINTVIPAVLLFSSIIQYLL